MRYFLIGAAALIVVAFITTTSPHVYEKMVRQGDLFLTESVYDTEAQRIHGFKPRQDVEPWPLKFPIDWGADPFRDRNWRFSLNSWKMQDPILSEYFRTNDERLLREALSYVEDWYRYHFVEEREHAYSWYDMAVGIRALRLAFFIDLFKSGHLDITSDQEKMLFELADAHIARLQVKEELSLGNHGLFQMIGLNLLCVVASDRPMCEEGRRYASANFAKIMGAQYTEEGIHTENSPDYHFFVLNTIKRLTAVEHLDNPVVSLLGKIESVGPWMVFPDGHIARIGDSAGKTNPLSEDPKNPLCNAARCFAVGDFSRSGYVVVRSLPSQKQSSMLFVTGMAHTIVHKHADELSFELFEFGRFIFIDSGKYGYKGGREREYVLSADAHNTIGIDGEFIGPTDVHLTGGSLLEPVAATPEGFTITGSVERPDLFQQHREIVYNPGISLTITDELTAPSSKPYVSSLHLAPDLEPQITDDGFTVEVDGHSIRAHVVSEGCEIKTVRGQKDPMLGWFSPSYLEMTPASVVRAICPGQARSIRWEISFQ